MKVNLNPIKEFRYNQISNYHFQFILLDIKNRALHSPFECKDYLQDIMYCEYTGKKAEIYGIKWEPGMLDINVSWFKVAVMGGAENLQEKMGSIKTFLNSFEDAQGIPRSKIYKTDKPEVIVIKFSKEWTLNGPLLSSFTTLIRLSGAYQGGNIIEYLKSLLEFNNKHSGDLNVPGKYFPNFMNSDVNRLDTSLNRLAALLSGKKIEHGWKDFQNIDFVHNTGLVGFKNFPTVEI